MPLLGVVSSCPWQRSGSCTGQESTGQKNTRVTGIEALGLVLDSETPNLKGIQKTPLREPPAVTLGSGVPEVLNGTGTHQVLAGTTCHTSPEAEKSIAGFRGDFVLTKEHKRSQDHPPLAPSTKTLTLGEPMRSSPVPSSHSLHLAALTDIPRD